MIWLQVIVLFCLAFICYQDLRYRAVYWICFPVLGLMLLFLKYNQTSFSDTLKDAAFGLAFFALQLLLLWLYFSLKNRKRINLTNAHLGWGDVLFLSIVPFYLSPLNYLAFYMGSLFLVLIYVAGTRLLVKFSDPQIPLAGLQALILGTVLIVSIYLPGIKLYDDGWFYGY